MLNSEAVTLGVRVQVSSKHLPEKSDPHRGHWFFAYRVRISNEGPESVQLISRHWIITDAEGAVEEVRGPGVVGEQPTLQPGESFEYTSFCPLSTPFGAMEGSFQMVSAGGAAFDAAIARFSLSEELTVN